MYIEGDVTISQIDDGAYLVSFRVKKPREKMKGDKGHDMDIKTCSPYEPSVEKVHSAKDVKEVMAILKSILPNMHKGKLPEEQYREAFEEAPDGE